MNITEAQKEIRAHFAGGFQGQLVASVLWAISAALAALASPSMAMVTLAFGGFLIFPITELLTRICQTPELSKTNELKGLGMQIAFVLPVSMLLLVPVVRYSANLFYPATGTSVLTLPAIWLMAISGTCMAIRKHGAVTVSLSGSFCLPA